MSDLPRDSIHGKTTALDRDERLVAVFQGDSGVYARSNGVVALAGAALAAGALLALGHTDVWAGPMGAILAVGLRALYLRSEALADEWHLTSRRLLGPGGRTAPLSAIKLVRPFFGAVQVVTSGGDKHLIKYQLDASATVATIEAAIRAAKGARR